MANTHAACCTAARNHCQGSAVLPEQDPGRSLQAVAGGGAEEEGGRRQGRHVPAEVTKQQAVSSLPRVAGSCMRAARQASANAEGSGAFPEPASGHLLPDMAGYV